MAQPTLLQRDYSRGVKRDFPRDAMPAGALWDCVDFIPDIIGAPLRKRGGWPYGSDAFGAGSYAAAVAFADFTTGGRLVGINDSGTLYSIALSNGAVTSEGSSGVPIAPPVLHRDVLVIPSADGTANVKKYLAAGGAPADLAATAPDGMYAAVYKDRTLLANVSGNQQRIYFGPAGAPTQAWDTTTSFIDASFPVAGLAALKNAVLVFGNAACERIRGTIPPPHSDMLREPLYDIGCIDARSIVAYGDLVIFANGDGIWMTDGAAQPENLAETSGFLTYWLTTMSAYAASTWTVAAGMHRGMYVVSILNGSTFVDALMVDVDRRSMVRLSNLKARMFARAEGIAEELYFALRSAARLGSLSAIFSPTDGTRNDADGTAVNPVFETPFFKDGPVTKRWNRAYLSYELTAPSTTSTLQLSYITAPEATSFTNLGSAFPEASVYTRARAAMQFRSRGVAFKCTQTAASADTRIHELGAEVHALEGSR